MAKSGQCIGTMDSLKKSKVIPLFCGMEGVYCVFDYEVNSTISEVKIPMKCTLLLHGGYGHPSGDLLLNQEAPNLKDNCSYGAFVQNSVFTHKNGVFYLQKQFSQPFILEGLCWHLCISEGRHLVTREGRKLYLCRWAFLKAKQSSYYKKKRILLMESERCPSDPKLWFQQWPKPDTSG